MDLTNHNYRIVTGKSFSSILSICFFLGGFHVLVAQDLETEKIEVVKNFEARLAESNKQRLEPAPEVKEVSNQKFDYFIEEKVMDVEYLPPSIKAIGISTSKPDPGYNGFVKAGFGYPLSPYLDAGYLFGIEDGSNLLARITHHSANDNSIENQRFAYNDVLLKGTLETGYGFAVDGFANVSVHNNPFYGYNHEDSTLSFTTDEVKNKLNLYQLGAKIYNSTESNAKLNYWAGFDAYRLNNNFATSELGLNIDLGLTKWFGDNPLSISMGTDLTRLKDTTTQNLNNFYVNPTFSFGSRAFRFKMGATMTSANETYNFYPDVEMLLNLSGGALSIFAGADGGLRKNNFKILSDYNPFLVSELTSIRNSSFYDFYAGAKGRVMGIEYSIQGGFKPTNDLALFEVNQEKDWNRFDVLYDTANIIYGQASLKGAIVDNLEVSANVVYNFYDLNNEEQAWYLPTLQSNVGISYLALDQKLRLKAEFYVTDAVEYEDLNIPEAPNLLFDVSFGADFFITENFGLFLHLNNLSTNNYRRWYGYPGYGLNVLGGLTARF